MPRHEHDWNSATRSGTWKGKPATAASCCAPLNGSNCHWVQVTQNGVKHTVQFHEFTPG